MSPLRFCFLTTFYPPYNFGGDGIGIQRLARGLVRRGHHVTVVHDVDAHALLRAGPEPRRDPTPDPAEPEVIPLRSGWGALSCLLTQQTGRPVLNGRRIRKILDRGRFHVLNFHNVSLLGGPGLLSYGDDALRLYSAHEHWLVCPMHVLWRHGRERCDGRECFRCTLRHRRPPQFYRWSGYLERQLEAVDTFLAASEFSRQKHREFGFRHDMEVLPYFLPDPPQEVPPPDRTEEPSPHGRPYFLFVGRLEKIKGLQSVIPLFERYPEADLLIAGDGDYRKVLERLAAGSGRVRFLGRVPQGELGKLYTHALALIVPSICFETFGIILIEAFRHRVPVIARRLGPFPEIVARSGGGELFDDGEGLLAAMHRFQRDEEYRDRLAARGHAALLEYWVESAVLPRYLDIVRATAERRGRRDIVERLEGGKTR